MNREEAIEKIGKATEKMLSSHCPINTMPCSSECIHFKMGVVIDLQDPHFSGVSISLPKCRLWR